MLSFIPCTAFLPSKPATIASVHSLLEMICRIFGLVLSICLLITAALRFILVASVSTTLNIVFALCLLILTKRRISRSTLSATSPAAFALINLGHTLASPGVGSTFSCIKLGPATVSSIAVTYCRHLFVCRYRPHHFVASCSKELRLSELGDLGSERM